MTQIERASYKSGKLLSKSFFDSKGYCKISSSLYYGFMIYYFNYLEAKENSCNGKAIMNRIVGAYNKYSSGFEPCFYDLSKNDKKFLNYQIGAIGGFLNNFVLKAWERKVEELKKLPQPVE